MRLLGPKYLLIDNPFKSNPNFEYLISNNKKTFRILLSLGGGGNLLCPVAVTFIRMPTKTGMITLNFIVNRILILEFIHYMPIF